MSEHHEHHEQHSGHTHVQADGPQDNGHPDHEHEHSHGHGGHGDHVGQFRRLFWVMLVLAVPVIVFSDMFAMILGYELPDISALSFVSPVLGTVMFFWGGWPFLEGAVDEIR